MWYEFLISERKILFKDVTEALGSPTLTINYLKKFCEYQQPCPTFRVSVSKQTKHQRSGEITNFYLITNLRGILSLNFSRALHIAGFPYL